jgi:hypothetical protein
MRNRAFLCLVFICISLSAFSQEENKVMCTIEITDSTSAHQAILLDVRQSFSNLVEAHGVTVSTTDLDVRVAMNEMNTQNYNDLDGNYTIPDDTAIDYKYQFWITEDNDSYTVWSRRIGKTKAEFERERGITKMKHLVNFPEIREFIAYEMFKSYKYQLTGDEWEKLNFLQQKESEYKDVEKRSQGHYTALSFLPPVNQFGSHTSKGTANGIAIISGYALSIGGFIWSTTSYNVNKRRFDNVSVDLAEAEKARNYYKGKMDLCRGGQIASAVLLAGSYIYGVVNALTNRDTYQKKEMKVKFAPVAYDNGAGLALVYNF